jgi:hypothetical protein
VHEKSKQNYYEINYTSLHSVHRNQTNGTGKIWSNNIWVMFLQFLCACYHNSGTLTLETHSIFLAGVEDIFIIQMA